MTAIENAVNVGPTLATELRQAGITTLEELRSIGYMVAWRRLQTVAPQRNCTNSCLALAGAIEGVRWMQLRKDVRARIAHEVKGI